MQLEPYTWRQVVTALKRCGIQIISEDDLHVFMGRFPYTKSISKRGRVPVSVQKDMLATWGLLHTEYKSFIPDEEPAN